jgi:AcrR family transcriptional regulator
MGNSQLRRRPGRPPFDEVAEGERRERILRVAHDLFGQRGYAAVSIADIAVEVGVTTAAIYHHFPSKDALYAEVMRRILGAIGGAIRQIAETHGAASEKMSRMAEVAILYVPSDADMDSMMRDVDEHLSAVQREEIDGSHRAVLGALEGLMREGIERGELRDGDPRLLSHAFWQLLGGFGGRRGSDAGFQGRPEVAEAVADLFLRGALAPGSGPAP